MEELITAIVVSVLFYGILRFFKLSWLKQAFPASFIYIAGIFAWCTALALIAVVFSLGSVVVDLISAFDSDLLVGLVVTLAILGVSTKLLVDRTDLLDVQTMIPFLRAAITFRPYDARRQELFERQERAQRAAVEKAAAAHAESGSSGEEVLDISDESNKSHENDAGAPAATSANTELDRLKRGESVDLTDIFKGSVAKMPSHPLYQSISDLRIDPAEKIMKFKIIFSTIPPQAAIAADNLARAKQGVYQVFQALMSEGWLRPYLEFFGEVKSLCARMQKDDFDMTREITFMTIQMTVLQLRQSRGKSFSVAEFGKIATITMEEP